jgi:succinoglycan biosynthesis protein ExoV
MPHHSSAGGDSWRNACADLNINYIDPTGFDIEKVINEISSSKLVIAEAMHAAIIADTFRVPWIAVSSVVETNNFKWQDWCGTLGLSYAPIRLTPIFPNIGNKLWKRWLNNIKQKMRKRQLALAMKATDKALLSDSRVLDAHIAEMDLQVQELQRYLEERGKT